MLENFSMADFQNGEVLPPYFRVTSIIRLPALSSRGVQNEATLYHDACTLHVNWHSSAVDCRIRRGSIVTLHGARFKSARENGCLPISRLALVDKPLASLNLFQTIPPSWVKDRASVQRAAALWEQLARPFQHLVNAVLWDGLRFIRFVTGPTSTSEHLRHPGSNFRHVVETAETARNLARGVADVSSSVVIAAALLHDAGKADDYRVTTEGYALSVRGYMVGGHHTILEWLAVARSKIIVPDAHYIALVHALIAARGESANGQSIEAAILAAADNLSRRSQVAEQLNGEVFVS